MFHIEDFPTNKDEAVVYIQEARELVEELAKMIDRLEETGFTAEVEPLFAVISEIEEQIQLAEETYLCTQ